MQVEIRVQPVKRTPSTLRDAHLAVSQSHTLVCCPSFSVLWLETNGVLPLERLSGPCWACVGSPCGERSLWIYHSNYQAQFDKF